MSTHQASTRWLALVCLLLFGWFSTAQAVHVHGRFLPRAAHAAQAPATDASSIGGEERCPLCVAAQPALPVVALVFTPLQALPEPRLQEREAFRAASSLWHPCSLSRPPPAQG